MPKINQTRLSLTFHPPPIVSVFHKAKVFELLFAHAVLQWIPKKTDRMETHIHGSSAENMPTASSAVG